MKRFGVSACIWLAAAALAGCAGEATYSGDVRVTSPELVAVQPGVEVVADADEPLFYVDGYYWLYRDGVWLRSDSYRSGFARIDVNIVPVTLRQMPEPRAYAHFSRTERGKAIARGSTMPERTAQRPQGTDRYRPPEQGPMNREQQPMGQQPTAPQPPEPARPAQPNPMPDHQQQQQQQQPDQGRPQGAETGNTPQTGGENQDRDRDQRQGEGMDRGRDLDMPSHAQQRDKDKDKDKDKDRPINKKDQDQDH